MPETTSDPSSHRGKRSGTRSSIAIHRYGITREFTWNQFVATYGSARYRMIIATRAIGEKNVGDSFRRMNARSVSTTTTTRLEIESVVKPHRYSAHML